MLQLRSYYWQKAKAIKILLSVTDYQLIDKASAILKIFPKSLKLFSSTSDPPASFQRDTKQLEETTKKSQKNTKVNINFSESRPV